MNETFSPVYTLFTNSYVVALDFIFIGYIAYYLIAISRSNRSKKHVPFVIAFTVYLIGNTVGRTWVTAFRWLSNHGYDVSWMYKIALLPISLILVTIGLTWIIITLLGARFGYFYGLLAATLATAVAFLLSL